jgi:hypothetical protein
MTEVKGEKLTTPASPPAVALVLQRFEALLILLPSTPLVSTTSRGRGLLSTICSPNLSTTTASIHSHVMSVRTNFCPWTNKQVRNSNEGGDVRLNLRGTRSNGHTPATSGRVRQLLLADPPTRTQPRFAIRASRPAARASHRRGSVRAQVRRFSQTRYQPTATHGSHGNARQRGCFWRLASLVRRSSSGDANEMAR